MGKSSKSGTPGTCCRSCGSLDYTRRSSDAAGCVGKLLLSFADVPGGADGKDALIALHEEQPFQQAATLIVEEVLKPAVFDKFRYDDDDFAIGMLPGEIEDELNDGNNDEAIRRRQDLELRRFLAGGAEGLLDVALPVFAEQFGVFGGLDVQGDYFGGKPGGEFDALSGDVAPPIDGNNRDGRLAESCGIDGNPATGQEFDVVVMAADEGEEKNRCGNEEQCNPGAIDEFRDENNDDGDSGD